MVRFFLDTSCLIAVYAKHSPSAIAIWFGMNAVKLTSEYVLKELRRALLDEDARLERVNDVVDEVRRKCTVVKITPQQAKGIALEDKSDIPIVAGARACNAVLLTLDRKLHAQARKYVKTAFPEELAKT